MVYVLKTSKNKVATEIEPSGNCYKWDTEFRKSIGIGFFYIMNDPIPNPIISFILHTFISKRYNLEISFHVLLRPSCSFLFVMYTERWYVVFMSFMSLTTYEGRRVQLLWLNLPDCLTWFDCIGEGKNKHTFGMIL